MNDERGAETATTPEPLTAATKADPSPAQSLLPKTLLYAAAYLLAAYTGSALGLASGGQLSLAALGWGPLLVWKYLLFAVLGLDGILVDPTMGQALIATAAILSLGLSVGVNALTQTRLVLLMSSLSTFAFHLVVARWLCLFAPSLMG